MSRTLEQQQPLNRRWDIQALRAVAVLLVVLSHFSSDFLPGGFVGVDMFFVVSGFVVWGAAERIEFRSRISGLIKFFFRRIGRIAPSYFVVVSVISVVGFFLAPQNLKRDFLLAASSSAAYISNVFFVFTNTDYWSQGGDSSPFLHTWSLAVEVQVYLALGFIFFAFARRQAQRVLWLAFFVSLALWCYQGMVSPPLSQFFFGEAAFYFLPFGRVWEFALGALIVNTRLFLPNPKILGSLLIVFAVAVEYVRPDLTWIQVLFAAIGTAILILSPTDKPSGNLLKSLFSRGVEWIGDRSYALYLVHWPLFVWTRPLPWFSIWVAGILTVAGAWALHEFVDRSAQNQKSKTDKGQRLFFSYISLWSIAAFLLPLVALWGLEKREDSYEKELSESEPGFNNYLEARQDCEYSPQAIECGKLRTSGERWLLLGDSFAYRLTPALATLAAENGASLSVKWSSECRTDFSSCAGGELTQGYSRIVLTTGWRVQPEVAEENIMSLLKRRDDNNSEVFVIAPIPFIPSDYLDCIFMSDLRRLIETPCSVPRGLWLDDLRMIDAKLRSLAGASDKLNYVELSSAVCPSRSSTCDFSDPMGRYLFDDSVHLSSTGAFWVVEMLRNGMGLEPGNLGS